ncbi:MAG: sensor domain-containing diguanylate cyclase [Pseudoxanthomonas sp.]
MSIQSGLARIFPRSFSARMMAVAFVGIHVPLIVLAIWLVLTNHLPLDEMLLLLGIVLGATLLGTACTLWVQRLLLAPLRQAADALDEYNEAQRLPNLPVEGSDEVARLMRGINRSVQHVDEGLRELEKHVLTDSLTGTLNRRGCEQSLAASVALAAGTHKPLTLFVLDMDNLKQINDRLGHQAGDRALITLVDGVGQWLRPGDWVGRWGGDEFLVAVHDAIGVACARMEALRLDLEAGVLHGNDPPVYLSAGVSGWEAGQTAFDLYRKADKAMYRAKFSGGRKLELEGPSV